MLVKVLPEVVAAAAAPFSSVDKMTVISADGPNALARSVASNVAQGLQLSGDLTGLDVTALLRRLTKAQDAADGVTRIPVDGVSPDGNGAAPR
jgi:flotillin